MPAPRSRQLVVMARWPAPGRCKTRLAAGIGAAAAAAVQRRLTLHAITAARRALQQLPARLADGELVLAVAGLAAQRAQRWGRELGVDRVVLQGSGRLGARLQRQWRRAGREGCRRLVLIGSDLPELEPAEIAAAFLALEVSAWVLGPAWDGGYWLVGGRCPSPSPFIAPGTPIPWGRDGVLAATLTLAERHGIAPRLLARRHDLDTPADLQRWR
ncbi:MAG: TIGR04282 family arsenosugar biosynthesis glycosyltransferase [Synechococcaceae cyanobacterium]|nr:TIGR04282 family arsenosugar biosynthesis glycosyltransferase [Synechococcaceae cyanobacterium]